MPHEITLCEDCDNVCADTRKRSPYKWLCIAAPRIEGGSFVAPRAWAATEPYMPCRGINGGACRMYVPRRNGKLQELRHDDE